MDFSYFFWFKRSRKVEKHNPLTAMLSCAKTLFLIKSMHKASTHTIVPVLNVKELHRRIDKLSMMSKKKALESYGYFDFFQNDTETKDHQVDLILTENVSLSSGYIDAEDTQRESKANEIPEKGAEREDHFAMNKGESTENIVITCAFGYLKSLKQGQLAAGTFDVLERFVYSLRRYYSGKVVLVVSEMPTNDKVRSIQT